jgi:predicted nucleotidyltransferase
VDNGVLTIGEIKRRVAVPARQHGLKKVYLFGSYARGEATPKSDIDLCVDDSNIRSLFELSGLFLDMKEALQSNIDMVTTGGIDGEFKEKIMKEWKIIYE